MDASEKYGDTSLGHHAVQAASRLSRANASREDFNDIGIPAQAMPSNSQVSIGSALDELMNEDGAACNVIALEKPVLPISVTSSTSSTRKSASPKEPQPALPSGGGRKTSSKGISSPLRSIVEPVHQRVNDNSFSESIAPSAVSTTQSASLETSQTVSNEANNKVLTSQTEIDPDIASIIRKPGGVASFLNNLAPSFQREHIMRQGHEDDGLGGQAIQTNNADDLASIEPLDELFGDNVYTPADAIIYPTVPEPADNLDTSETAGNGVLAGAGRSLSTRCAEVDAPLEGANQPTAICQTYAARSSSAAPQLQALAIEQAGMPIAYASHATPTDTMRKALQPIGPYVQHTKATSSQNISDNSTLNSLAIANLKINPIFIKVLSDNAFVNISDLAEARMNRDDIRLLVASIQEEQKISKSETIVAILRLDAALQRFQQQKRMAH